MDTNSNAGLPATSPNLKNTDLAALYPEQLASGQPFVTHISPPKEGSDNELYQQMYIAQRRNLGGGVSAIEQMFLGWDSARIVRTIQNTKPARIADMGIQEGFIFKQLNIQVRHETKPQYEAQTPRVFPLTSARAGSYISYNGEVTYEHTDLVAGTPTDRIWKADKVGVSSVSVAQAEEDPDNLSMEE